MLTVTAWTGSHRAPAVWTDTGTGRSPRLMSGFQGRPRTVGNIANSSKWFIKEIKPQQWIQVKLLLKVLKNNGVWRRNCTYTLVQRKKGSKKGSILEHPLPINDDFDASLSSISKPAVWKQCRNSQPQAALTLGLVLHCCSRGSGL